jgi:hypothetical protein
MLLAPRAMELEAEQERLEAELAQCPEMECIGKPPTRSRQESFVTITASNTTCAG